MTIERLKASCPYADASTPTREEGGAFTEITYETLELNASLSPRLFSTVTQALGERDDPYSPYVTFGADGSERYSPLSRWAWGSPSRWARCHYSQASSQRFLMRW